MLDFKLLKSSKSKDEDIIYCEGCKKEIISGFYYDKNTDKVYCCKECYIKCIEKEYFDD